MSELFVGPCFQNKQPPQHGQACAQKANEALFVEDGGLLGVRSSDMPSLVCHKLRLIPPGLQFTWGSSL